VTGYLLDTNVISEVRSRRPHGALVAWLDAQQLEELFLSAVTIGELQAGVQKTRRQDPQKAQEIDVWIDQLIATYRVLAMDAACFREWARLMQGRPDVLSEDAMIAATARVHGLVVATRNERDFAHFDVRVLNPFKN
jgi:toxin FitB